jgi:hypothetical protein
LAEINEIHAAGAARDHEVSPPPFFCFPSLLAGIEKGQKREKTLTHKKICSHPFPLQIMSKVQRTLDFLIQNQCPRNLRTEIIQWYVEYAPNFVL